MEAMLKKMQAAAEAGRLEDEAAACEPLGRLKQQHWRASHAFDVTIEKLATPCGKQVLEITWQARVKIACLFAAPVGAADAVERIVNTISTR